MAEAGRLPAEIEPEPEPPRTGRQAGRLRAANRRYECYELALAGFSHRAIGERYGVSHAQVGRDIRYVAEERRKNGLQRIEQHRQLAIDRINRLYQASYSGINNGDPQAIRNADRLLRTLALWLSLGEGLKITVTHELEEIAGYLGVPASEVYEVFEQVTAEQQVLLATGRRRA